MKTLLALQKLTLTKLNLNQEPIKHMTPQSKQSKFRPILGMLPVLLACSPLMAQSDGAFHLVCGWNTGGSMLGADTSFSLRGGLRKDSASASYNADAQADSFFKILGFRAHVVEGNAAASFGLAMTPEGALANNLTSTGNADLNLRVMGLNIASFRREFVSTDSQVLASFNTSPLIKEVTFAEQRFMVGPVPVKVAAGASIEMRGEGTVQKLVAGGGHGIETRMGPVFDAALVASGAVDAFVAAAGVKAKASLAKAKMDACVGLTATPERGSIDYGLDMGFMGTNGEFSLFAKALLPGIEWRKIKVGFIRISIPVLVFKWHEWSTVIAAFRSAWKTTNVGRGTTGIW
jgi:hypothetical protein